MDKGEVTRQKRKNVAAIVSGPQGCFNKPQY